LRCLIDMDVRPLGADLLISAHSCPEPQHNSWLEHSNRNAERL